MKNKKKMGGGGLGGSYKEVGGEEGSPYSRAVHREGAE